MGEQLGLDLDVEAVEPGPGDVRHPFWNTASLSDDERYRYELVRRWDEGPLLEWAMLNPSTADADRDDPTIRRCIGFALDWRMAGIRVVNLFPLRATDPSQLLNATDRGVDHPKQLAALATQHGPVTVCAWGAHALTHINLEGTCWAALLKRSALMCLGYNNNGSPKHPLYVKKSAALHPWPKPQ